MFPGLFFVYNLSLVRCGPGSLVNCDNSASPDWSQWPWTGLWLVEAPTAKYKCDNVLSYLRCSPGPGTQEKRSGGVLATRDPRCVQMSGEKCWSLRWWWLHVSRGGGHSSVLTLTGRDHQIWRWNSVLLIPLSILCVHFFPFRFCYLCRGEHEQSVRRCPGIKPVIMLTAADWITVHACPEQRPTETKVLRWDFHSFGLHYTPTYQKNWFWNKNQREFWENALFLFQIAKYCPI